MQDFAQELQIPLCPYGSSEKSILFLELIISISERKLKTNIHIKSSDHDQYHHVLKTIIQRMTDLK